MWLSKQAVRVPQTEKDGGVAVVTVAGAQSAVQRGSELRGLAWMCPGGVFWAPESDQEVVTMTCAGGETLILGALPRPRDDLRPGEVCLSAGQAEIVLRRDGSVSVRGNVNVEGTLTVNGKAVKVEE